MIRYWTRALRASAAVLLLASGLTISGSAEWLQSDAPELQAEGKQLFEAHCATCHGTNGRGAERGPDIATARRATRPLEETARIVREGIPAGGMPPSSLAGEKVILLARYLRALAESAREPRTFARVRLALRDGRTLEGLVQNESNFDLQLLTSDGQLASFTRNEIAEVKELGRSALPDLKPRDVANEWGPGDWPTYNGNPNGNRHSSLGQITAANVAQMRLKWVFQAGNARNLRTTPVVVDGIMYVTAPNEVYALDARSGRQIWHYGRPRTPGVIGDAGAGVNRGVALSSDRLYLVTDDARLLALHRASGQLLWDVVMADYRQHYGATSAPLVVDDLVISGVSGGDEGVRGFLAAFDAASGKEVWRFWTVPAPGEPGSETWKGRAIEHPCAATWLTGSYDSKTNLLFWTTGNPCPDYNGTERAGDNLWSNSVLALEPKTGRLRWYYQFTPHDLNDWDSVQTVVAADTPFRGATRSLLMQANRNGFFYVLDRATGKLLLAEPFVKKLTWASGIGADGRPQRIAGVEPSVQVSVVCPSVVGATNWMSPAFHPGTGLFYVMALERCNIFRKSAIWFQPGESFYGGGTQNVPGEFGQKYLRALDVQTGKIRWEYPQIGSGNTWGGILSTTGVVFFAEDSGAFAAVDAQSGELLWHLQLNANWRGSPMTYLAGDQQFVAVAGGGNIFVFGL
ncbi:MAG TPA: PQQ-binding-like beta-propeller repeat protein [Vicinamibacterales bacterium]|nr:PQQ-binding-like beta-propeller repeat protein [Vicinamibacterales bacterium]